MSVKQAILLLSICAVCTATGGSEDPFRKWLHSLVIHIPPTSFEAAGYTFDLNGLNCSDIDLKSVSTDEPSINAIRYNVAGLGLQCKGLFDAANTKSKKEVASGTLGAKVEDSSSLTVGIQLITNETSHLATKAQAINVDSDIVIKSKDITFHSTSTLINLLEEIFVTILTPYIKNQLNHLINTELEGLINQNLTNLLQTVDNKIAPYLHPGPVPHYPTPPGAANLMTSPIIHLIDDLSRILISNTNLSLNAIIDDLTHGTGAIHADDLKNASVMFPISDLANITVGLLDLDIGGLDTWQEFDLIYPYDTTTIASTTFLEEFALNISIFIMLNTTGTTVHSQGLYEEVTLELTLKNASLNIYTFLAINDQAIADLSAGELISIGCLLDTVMATNISRIEFDMIVEDLKLISSTGGVEGDIDYALDELLELLLNGFAPVISPAINGLFAKPIQNELNIAIEHLLANQTCPAPQPSKSTSLLGTYIGGASAIFLCVCIAFFVRYHVRNHLGLKSAESLSLLASTSPPAPCLAVEGNVSTFLRYTFPVLILGTAAMFISSNTGVGATVNPVLIVGTDSIEFDPVFSFSLANTIVDMWNAGVYPLSLLVAVFSGTWPYVKLLMLIVCWIMPTYILSVRRRETLLQFLDGFGKWSLIDAYILTMMMIAFRFSLAIDDEYGQEVALEIYVRPQTSFHTFLLGTILSLLLSHLMLHVHRSAEKNHQALHYEEEKEALRSFEFVADGKLNSVTPFGTIILVVGLLGMIALVCVGAIFPAFEFKFEGLAALGLNVTGQPTTRTFSLLSMANALPNSSDTPDAFGIRYIQAIMFTFPFVVPILHMLFMCAVWVIPMTTKSLERCFVATEILYAWSSLEVFVVSLLAAVLEIEQFSQFIIGDRCDAINAILVKYFDKILHHDDKCFDVIATVNSGSWTLFGACIAAFIYTMVVMRICHQAVRQRMLDAGVLSTQINTTTLKSTNSKGCCTACGSCFGRAIRSVARFFRVLHSDYVV